MKSTPKTRGVAAYKARRAKRKEKVQELAQGKLSEHIAYLKSTGLSGKELLRTAARQRRPYRQSRRRYLD